MCESGGDMSNHRLLYHQDWLAGNQDNVSEWSDMSNHRLLYHQDWLAGNQDNVSEWGRHV